MSDIGYLMKVIQENMERHANQIYKPVDLTSSQVRILKFVREQGTEKTTQKDIERFLKVSHPTVVGILQRMEHKGVITTEFDGEDKRNKYVYLTPKEAQLYQQMKESHARFEMILTAGMTAEQVAQLKHLLTLVLENVKD